MRGPRKPDTVERYTRKARNSRTRDHDRRAWRISLSTGLDRLMRTLLYGVLRLLIPQSDPALPRRLSDVRSILIIPFGEAIGDLLLATSLWRAIKNRNPECRVGIFVSPRNESLVKEDPDVDVLYEFAGRKDLAHFSELKRARRDRYEVILNCHSSHQSDYGLFASYISPHGIKATTNHPRKELYRILFNHIGSRPRHSLYFGHISLELLSELVEAAPPFLLREAWPTLAISDSKRARVRQQLRDLNIRGRYIVIHQQASTAFREWGLENSVSLGLHIREAYPDMHILLTSSPSFHGDTTVPLPSDGITYFRTTRDLIEMAALLEGASLILSPDTSVMHFASAVGTPVIVLLPDANKLPIEWLPIGVVSRLLAPDVSGDPVESIPVKAVYDAALSILNGDWSQAQTNLDPSTVQHPAYQRENAERPLSEFVSSFYS